MAYSARVDGTRSGGVETGRGKDGATVTRAILVVLVASVILLGSVTVWQQNTIRHQSDMIANMNFLLAEAHMTAVVMTAGTSFTVQSSWDCLATHYSEVFDVVKSSTLEGGFNATGFVTLYVSTAQQAGDVLQGHPSSWIYSSGPVNVTSFSVNLPQGQYVLWFEGENSGCGGIVEPLEMLVNVTVTNSITLP